MRQRPAPIDNLIAISRCRVDAARQEQSREIRARDQQHHRGDGSQDQQHRPQDGNAAIGRVVERKHPARVSR